MDKRERLEKTLLGEATDRTPVALWRYWPGDDQRAADLARSTLEFQRTYDWDFIKVTPHLHYCVADYGVQTEWRGDANGMRSVLKVPVKRSLDWTELRPPDPMRGEIGKYLEALRLIVEGAKQENVPVIATVYSPLSQAMMMTRDELALRNMRTHPDRLNTGLNIITDGIQRMLDAFKQIDLDGIFYIVDQASLVRMSVPEYSQIGLPHDRQILDELPDQWWLNILSLPEDAPMFEFASTYPMPCIHWDGDGSDLDKAQSTYRGAFCMGLCPQQHMNLGTPTIVRDVARDVIRRMADRHLILGASGAVPTTTPLANIRAVRQAVEVL